MRGGGGGSYVHTQAADMSPTWVLTVFQVSTVVNISGILYKLSVFVPLGQRSHF